MIHKSIRVQNRAWMDRCTKRQIWRKTRSWTDRLGEDKVPYRRMDGQTGQETNM